MCLKELAVDINAAYLQSISREGTFLDGFFAAEDVVKEAEYLRNELEKKRALCSR